MQNKKFVGSQFKCSICVWMFTFDNIVHYTVGAKNSRSSLLHVIVDFHQDLKLHRDYQSSIITKYFTTF